MKRFTYFSGVLLILILSISGCGLVSQNGIADNQSVTEVPEGMTNVVLDLGGTKAPLDTVLTWGTLTVSGGGMDTITQTADGNIMALTVPSGPLRSFVLTAETGTVFYKGETITDLIPGETTALQIAMKLDAIKPLIIDTYSQRIIQIDDISGVNRVNSADLSSSGTYGYNPQAVDVDSNGYVYTAMPMIPGPGSIVMRTPVLDTRTPDLWETYFDGRGNSSYDFSWFKIRRLDNFVFVKNTYSSTGITPIIPVTEGPQKSIEASTVGMQYNSTPLGTLYDIEILDNGQIAVLGNTGTYAALAIYEYEAAYSYDTGTTEYTIEIDQWTEIAFLGSDINTDLNNVSALSPPFLTHKGNTIYICGTNNSTGFINFMPVNYNSSSASLTYSATDIIIYPSAYQIVGVIPSLDSSLIFRTFNSGNSVVLQFSTPNDASPLEYDGGAETFDFNDMYF